MGWIKCARMGLVVLALLALVVSPLIAGDHEKLVAMEKKLWKAWQEGDAGPFEMHLTDGNIWVLPSGIKIGKEKQIAAVTGGSCEVKSFELGEITAHAVIDGVVILTYESSQDAVCEGTKVPERIYASSVWVERDGKWYNAMYHETAAAN